MTDAKKYCVNAYYYEEPTSKGSQKQVTDHWRCECFGVAIESPPFGNVKVGRVHTGEFVKINKKSGWWIFSSEEETLVEVMEHVCKNCACYKKMNTSFPLTEKESEKLARLSADGMSRCLF